MSELPLDWMVGQAVIACAAIDGQVVSKDCVVVSVSDAGVRVEESATGIQQTFDRAGQWRAIRGSGKSLRGAARGLSWLEVVE